MRATITIFTRDNINADTELSLWTVTGLMENFGFASIELTLGMEAEIERARSIAATKFLDNQYAGDVWFMLDSDIVFNAVDMLKLMRTCYEKQTIVSGVYTTRKEPIEIPIIGLTKDFKLQMGSGLVQVKYVPAGFCAIPRCVLEDVAKGLHREVGNGIAPFFKTLLLEGDHGDVYWLSEDNSFCERARESGYKPLVDTDILLYHRGAYDYSVLDLGVDASFLRM